jgi:hypothetical protein
MTPLSLFLIAATLTPGAEPALADKPAVLEKLKALKPGEAVTLGKADVVGEFNATAKEWDLPRTGPRGRDFSIKMCWAEDRKRALFCGANHGVPHRLNDVWEFDLGSLTWAMLYAPDHNRDYLGLGKDPSDVEVKDGTFVTKRGGPGIIAHTWWGLAYDADAKKLFMMNTWVTDQKKAVALLGGKPEDLAPCPPLWSFDPATRAWKFHRTEKPFPVAPFGGMLEYLPPLKRTVWHTNNWQMQATWLYDLSKNAWENAKANGDAKAFEKEAPQPEQVGYYDPKRDMLVVHRHWETFHYAVKDNRWKKVRSEPKDSPSVPYGHDAFSPMYRDAATGQGLLVEFKTNALWSYDPDTVSWKKLTPTGDAMPTGGKRLAYADPAHNVFVIIDGTTVWAYRHGK